VKLIRLDDNDAIAAITNLDENGDTSAHIADTPAILDQPMQPILKEPNLQWINNEIFIFILNILQ
jgi:hypothetical protein